MYGLNREFKSILHEVKNGAISSSVYIWAKTIIVFPIFFLFAIFSLGVPLYVIQQASISSIGIVLVIFACMMFAFESLAECLSVWFANPVAGMLSFSMSHKHHCSCQLREHSYSTSALFVSYLPVFSQCVLIMHFSCTMVS